MLILDRAEDRELFDQVIKQLGLKQPVGKTAMSEVEVLACAHEIGYPVLCSSKLRAWRAGNGDR